MLLIVNYTGHTQYTSQPANVDDGVKYTYRNTHIAASTHTHTLTRIHKQKENKQFQRKYSGDVDIVEPNWIFFVCWRTRIYQ